MRYLLLIYTSETANQPSSPEEGKVMMTEYEDYTKWLADSGMMLGGDALQSTATATTVRVREGATLTTDGPFAETKEQLGGYYMIDAKDLDAAIDVASRIPGAKVGSIEVRPVMEFE
ncbi:MAG: hypothetical protein QOF60_3303 [Actinomycetota bacterium]|jgi:hypothetical protein|nr:hypothetical protein [Actinomycetota bacterium]